MKARAMPSVYALILLTSTVSILTRPVLAVDRAVDPEMIKQLRLSPTDLDRAELLSPSGQESGSSGSSTNWIFDFRAQSDFFKAWPGGVINANAATFPTMTGRGMTMAYILLAPCSMLPPHLHPRADNVVVAVEGTTETVMLQENGASVVRTTLDPGKMTLFPRGSIHSMQNTGCDNATLISALNSEDTGTLNIVNGLFGLPRDIIAAAFGGDETLLDKYDKLLEAIPDIGTGANVGSAECLTRCNILP